MAGINPQSGVSSVGFIKLSVAISKSCAGHRRNECQLVSRAFVARYRDRCINISHHFTDSGVKHKGFSPATSLLWQNHCHPHLEVEKAEVQFCAEDHREHV